MKPGPLANAKHEAFCQFYLVSLNATQAAEEAGYKVSRARQTGADLVSKRDIQERIAELKAERAERVEITADMVLSGLYGEATREGEGSSHGARVSAYGLLAKHLGLLVDRQDITSGGKPLVAAVITRVNAPPDPAVD